MSHNNVRGPTSALTEFLRASGITPSTVARRATQNQSVPGPSNTSGEPPSVDETSITRRTSKRGRRARSGRAGGYASDELDELESPPKKSKIVESQGKGKGNSIKRKKKATKKGDDDEYEDEDEDAYNALSKSMWANPGPYSKPAIGSFEQCAKCEKQFTVTRYTIVTADGTGSLCHPCAKSSGTDPFKKSAVRKRKQPTEKRKVVYFEEKRFPSLVSVCIDIISEYIDDIEAFGDVGAMNTEAISKAIAKNRRLTPDNAHLFYGAHHTLLTFYDATKLSTPSLITLAQLNPNLTSLRLDLCGQISDDVMDSWKTTLPNVTSLELLGPYLVRAPAWIAFFENHKPLESFLITQSPRFNLECMKALVASSATTLRRLGLREIGHMCDEFLEHIGSCKSLLHLDVSEPTNSCTDIAVNTLLSNIGPTLTKLNLSNHSLLTDAVLEFGVAESTHQLSDLVLRALPLLTDEGVSKFFSGWSNHPLSYVNFSRNPDLLSSSLSSLLHHSRSHLQVLDINGLKDVELSALKMIANCPELTSIDLGWCRAVDDFVLKQILEGCTKLTEVKVWGCNKVEGKWISAGIRTSARIVGIEGHTTH
ncbi:hypothetical protein E1B28_004309 [Marasmius oreades]|uniref:DNA repair protein rhp7 treble clef domain-containing protein n=1 Tax=Marasmius oreades TaxID=181124 RepID=A0A9P7UY91_9AGAR|nr:uncharacterized protein E1B28_004309 [Marasmius oreades]KAG7096904.1 hypothetical protein E1B28_004309 [Marasmius oreades]